MRYGGKSEHLVVGARQRAGASNLSSIAGISRGFEWSLVAMCPAKDTVLHHLNIFSTYKEFKIMAGPNDATGNIEIVSTAANGTQMDYFTNHTYSLVFSPDGSKIAFQSNSDFVTGDTNGYTSLDIFVKDLATGPISGVATDADGVQNRSFDYFYIHAPVFSPDGNKIAFSSYASNLVPGDTKGPLNGSDIFVKDLAIGAIQRVSTAADGRESSYYSTSLVPAFSPDGTKIAFYSTASNLVPGDTNGAWWDIFVKDLTETPVNHAPVAGVDGPFDVRYHGSVAASSLLVNDSDPDSDPLTAVLVTDVSHGALTFRADGTFQYTPTRGYIGTDSFTYAASDGTLTSDPVTVTLQSIDTAPVAVADNYTTAEGAPLTIAAPAGVLANDTDYDGGETLTAALVAGPAHGTFVFNADGSFTYTLATDYSGADSFTYKASDGTLASNVATVSLTVTRIDHPPV
jgi:VCBS repeat-containing protein